MQERIYLMPVKNCKTVNCQCESYKYNVSDIYALPCME